MYVTKTAGASDLSTLDIVTVRDSPDNLRPQFSGNELVPVGRRRRIQGAIVVVWVSLRLRKRLSPAGGARSRSADVVNLWESVRKRTASVCGGGCDVCGFVHPARPMLLSPSYSLQPKTFPSPSIPHPQLPPSAACLSGLRPCQG